MTKELIEVVSELKFESFQEVIKGLLSKNSENIVVEKNGLKVQKFGTSKMSVGCPFENLEHKETGCSIKTMVEKINSIIPESKKTGIVIEESIPNKEKMNRGLYVLKTRSTFTGNTDENESKRIPVMSPESVKGVNEFLDDKLSGVNESQSLSTLILHLFLESQTESLNLNFITNVEYSSEKNSTYSKIKSKRRAISKMGDDYENKTKNYIIITEYSKSQIENLVNELKLEANKITIKTAEEMIAIVNCIDTKKDCSM